MMRDACDRTFEVKIATQPIEIWCKDCCDEFEQDKDRLFASKECWFCVHGNFGLYTEAPVKIGTCGRCLAPPKKHCIAPTANV